MMIGSPGPIIDGGILVREFTPQPTNPNIWRLDHSEGETSMLGKQIIRYTLVLTVGLVLSAGSAAARTLGLVADSGKVIVFDADTDTVLGSVAIPGSLFDVAISNVQKLGFVTDFGSHVWVIDLTVPTNPVLAAGVNPIPISNPGEDLSLTPDQRFLVVTEWGRLSNTDLSHQHRRPR